MNKGYFQELLRQLSKSFIKDNNKLAQWLEEGIRIKNSASIGYDIENDLEVIITIEKKK